MRGAQLTCVALGLAFLLLEPARAADEPKTIIERAIQAAGGTEKLAKLKSARIKATGTTTFMGQDLPVSIETIYVLPSKYKSQLTVNGTNAVEAFDGDKGWMTRLGETKELPAAKLRTLKEIAYTLEVEQLLSLLKDKTYTLSALSEIKVSGKPAVGVKVSADGHKPIELYFDKESWLPVRTVRFGTDATMKDVKHEITYSDHKEMGGVKHPTKSVFNTDGKKTMELVTTELKPLDKVDDKEFARP